MKFYEVQREDLTVEDAEAPKQRLLASTLSSSLLDYFGEIIKGVNFVELSKYLKILVDYPNLYQFARMGDSKSCEKMSKYLASNEVGPASQHYATQSMAFKMTAAPLKHKGKPKIVKALQSLCTRR